ncbi:hypothetical protein, partial [Bacteroides thetaiotaomicron]|uniref:hypothetical protein n=1 Tax=Bacteroides thetaiotaomicron TaxID=818 RepID=UPI00210DD1FE
RQTLFQPCLILIDLSVSYHTETYPYSVTIAFLIWIFKMYYCVGQIHSLDFQQLISGQYIHHNISFFFRSSE